MDQSERKEADDAIRINPLKLDDACVENPSLLRYYGESLGEARGKRDTAKIQVARIRAIADLTYRQNPPKDVKITESTIAALVTENEEVQKAEDDLLESSKEVYELESIIDALQDRRSELKNLTELWIGGYFGTPSTSGKDQQREDLHQKMRENLKRREE